MLVLSRNNGQGLTVSMPDGKTIRLQILDSRKGKIRIGVSAPDEGKILRYELLPVKDAQGLKITKKVVRDI